MPDKVEYKGQKQYARQKNQIWGNYLKNDQL